MVDIGKPFEIDEKSLVSNKDITNLFREHALKGMIPGYGDWPNIFYKKVNPEHETTFYLRY